MINVIPAIIPHAYEQFAAEIKTVSKFAKMIQMDIADGAFIKTTTWPYNGRDNDFFQKLVNEEVGWPEYDHVEFEVHLMVQNPEESVFQWIRTGVTSVVAHIEATTNFQKVIDICREHNVQIGVAIKTSTNISMIEPYIPQVDFVQVMGSDLLGKHGVELDMAAVLPRVKALRKLYPERIIGIDIGVTRETAEPLVEAGATRLVSGSTILGAPNPELAYRDLQSLGS
jgi:ribulose-phosphate 3-epimerase